MLTQTSGSYKLPVSSGPSTHESTTTSRPGTAYSRMLGGDDYAAGIAQNIDRFHGITTVSFTPGGTLVLTNS